MEKRSEEREEEEDFRRNKEDYPQPHTTFHFTGVFALEGRLAGHVPPPLQYGGQNERKTETHQPLIHFVHVCSESPDQEQPTEGSGEGPRPRVYDVEGMLSHMPRHKGRRL